ncbi:SusC/RagA family TonB-linked outer membrane protein [Fodinibius sediminis]|nr:SusC/RagA family TonB-linked outer membrane protein [Fodinibius sediminis]
MKPHKWIANFFAAGMLLGLMALPIKAQDGRHSAGQVVSVNTIEQVYNAEVTHKVSESSVLLKRVSLKTSEESLISILKRIADKGNLSLSYDTQLSVLNEKLTLSLKQVSIKDALWTVLDNTGLRFAVSSNRQLILMRKSEEKSLEKIQETIKGTVTDASSGETLPGVNILVKGTTTGTSTDAEGSFELTVPSLQDTLVVSFIGYQTREIPIDGRTTIAINLQPQAIAGEEVVVVGYGEQERENVTGSITSVSFNEELENRPMTGGLQALSGKSPGVWVSQQSGAPGEDTPQIRVRGFGTLNNNDPLILIDGVEGQMSDLNPNDIESISVLKDASSAAIYGSRAANGVVLVTTKEGTYGAGMQASYSGSYGWQRLGRRYDIIDNSVQFMNIWNTAVEMEGGAPIFPEEVLSYFKNTDDPYLAPNTNFFDHVYQIAPQFEHNFSVSGGTPDFTYNTSINYLSQEGIMKRTSSDRYGLNINVKGKITEWAELQSNLRVTRRINDRPYGGRGRTMYIFQNGAYPFIAPYTREGNFGATQAVYLSGPNEGNPIVDSRNPLADQYNGQDQNTINFYRGTVSAVIDILDGLSANPSFTAEQRSNVLDRWNEINYVYTDGGVQSTTLDYDTNLRRHRDLGDEFYWNFHNTFDYETTLSEHHDVSALAGIEFESQTFKSTYVEQSDPPKESLKQVSTGTAAAIAQGNMSEWRMQSYFGRLNYNYDQRYQVEGTFRADGSSRFREGNRWGFFPSFSLGWRISEESFMDGANFLDNLRLRGSWGRLGNQNISVIAGNYPYLSTFTQNNSTSYNLNGTFQPGAAITSLVDKSISWETVEQINLGLEAGFMDNRLTMEFDIFDKKTSDILVQLPIPNTLGGVTPPVENVGEMSNKGLEIAMSYQSDVSRSSNWNYNISANVSHVVNEVTSFRGGEAPDQLYLIREGVSYQSLFGYNAIGIYQTDDEAEQHMPNSSHNPRAGDIKYEDLNNDGSLGNEDQKVLGNTIPKYTFGFNFGLSYKNWSLNAVLQGQYDVTAYTQNAWTQPLGISGATVTERWSNAWTPDNKSNELPRIRIGDQYNRLPSSFWTTDISYLKIQNVQLNYDFPSNWTDKASLRGANAYLNISNPYTLVSDNYEGFDPERSTFGSGAYQYPTPVVTSIGIKLNF